MIRFTIIIGNAHIFPVEKRSSIFFCFSLLQFKFSCLFIFAFLIPPFHLFEYIFMFCSTPYTLTYNENRALHNISRKKGQLVYIDESVLVMESNANVCEKCFSCWISAWYDIGAEGKKRLNHWRIFYTHCPNGIYGNNNNKIRSVAETNTKQWKIQLIFCGQRAAKVEKTHISDTQYTHHP